MASPLFVNLISSAKEKSVGHQVLGSLDSLSPERAKETEDCVISCCMLPMLLLSESFPRVLLPSSRNPCVILLLLLQISSTIPSFCFCSPGLCLYLKECLYGLLFEFSSSEVAPVFRQNANIDYIIPKMVINGVSFPKAPLPIELEQEQVIL